MIGTSLAWLRAIHETLRDANVYRLFALVGALTVLGTLGMWYFEGVGIFNAIWWSIVTLTTVGYGDISPATPGGRFTGVVLMILGIGVLGAFTAQIASLLFERQRLKHKGLLMLKDMKDHIIFSGWSPRARATYDELRSDERAADVQVVLIAELDEEPVDDRNFHFIRGKTTEATLKQANLSQARTVVIFGDPKVDAETSDAKAVLHTLMVEDINPNVYTIVELALSSSQVHCERAHADEIIVGSEFSSRLLSRAVLDHGISKVVSELVNPRFGKELYKMPLDPQLVGETFEDALRAVKHTHDCLIIGIETHGEEGTPHVVTNPPADRLMQKTDLLIVIGEQVRKVNPVSA